MKACGDGMEVRYFDNAMTALTDFVESTGVKAEKLPTEEKAKEIEKELQALPPLGWLSSSNWEDAAVQIATNQRALRAGMIGSGYSARPSLR